MSSSLSAGGLAVGLRPAWGEALLPPGGGTLGGVRGAVLQTRRQVPSPGAQPPSPRPLSHSPRAEPRKGLWVLRPAGRGPGEEQGSLRS